MSARPPSLSSIAAFEAAARHQSFTGAARELHLTQSAVSHAIKALEARLGDTLFERKGRGVVLSEAGRELASRVRLSLALLGDAFETAPWLERQRLVVTTLPSIAEKMLLPRLRGFRETFPEMELDIRCGAALADLGEGDADLAIRFGPGQWAGLHSRRVAGEWLFPVASPDFRGGDLPRSIEELRLCNLIWHPESAWRLWFAPLGMDVSGLSCWLRIDDAAIVSEAAVAGLGVALARAALVEEDLRTGRLVRLFDHKVPAEYSYWCAWTERSAKRATIEAFVDWLIASFEG